MIRFLLLLALLIPVRAQAQTQLPMDVTQWTLWTGGPDFLSQGVDSIFFDFPQTTWCGTPGTAGSDCGDVYSALTFDFRRGVALSGTLTATFRVETVPSSPPNPVSFDWETEAGNTCFGTPATTRFYMAEFVNSVKQSNTHRWYSSEPHSYILQDSGGATITLSVPLTQSNWQDVFNDGSVKGWNDTVHNVNRIGFVAGGGCYFGHAVSVSQGTASFQLYSFGWQ